MESFQEVILRLLTQKYQCYLRDNYNNLLRCIVKHGDEVDLQSAITYGYSVPTPEIGVFTMSRSALHDAAELDKFRMVEILLSSGMPIDEQDDIGWTPLTYAARNGCNLTIQILVERGSLAIDTPDKSGLTPILHASTGCHAFTIELLLRLGSQTINAVDVFQRTCFHLAVGGHARFSRIVDTLETLMKHGCVHLDTLDQFGNSPLELALDYYVMEPRIGRQVLKIIETLSRLGSQRIDNYLLELAVDNLVKAIPRHVTTDPLPESECAIIHTLIALGCDESQYFDVKTGEVDLESIDETIETHRSGHDEDDLDEEEFARVRGKVVSFLQVPMTQEEKSEIRFRIFFSQSLTSRALLAIK